MAEVAGDDLLDVGEAAAKHVDDVVGQERLGQRGEPADVGEQHGDRPSVTDRRGAFAPAGVGELHVLCIEHQAANGDIAT